MSMIEIQIIVAIDEVGNIECVPYVPYHLQYKQKSDDFISKKRKDEKLWQLSYLKAFVPVPTEPIIEASVENKHG